MFRSLFWWESAWKRKINTDPFFLPYKNEIDGHFKEMKSKLYKTTEAILHNTNTIRDIVSIINSLNEMLNNIIDIIDEGITNNILYPGS